MTSWSKLAVLTVLALTGASFTGANAHALDITHVGAGFSRAVPMGNQYVGLGTSTTFYGEALANGLEFLGPGFRWHATVQYQKYNLKSATSAGYNLFAVGIGINAQAHASAAAAPKNGKGKKASAPDEHPFLNPFFSALVGGAANWLSLSGGTSQINASMGLMLEAIPGVEFPIIDSLSGCVSFPIQYYSLGQSLSVWNALFNVRWAL